MRLLFAILLTFLASFVSLPAQSAIFHYSFKEKTVTIYDEFVYGDSELFSKIIEKNGAPRLVRLESTGGNFSEALGIGLQIHDLKINTETIGGCFSACAFVWLAGDEFKIGAGSIIGIHTPANVYLDSYKSETNNYIDAGWYLGKIDAPLAATKNFLSIPDLKSMFTITADKLEVFGYEKVDEDTFRVK